MELLTKLLVGVGFIIVGIIAIVKRSISTGLGGDPTDTEAISIKGPAALAIGVVMVIMGLALVLWASLT